MSDLLDFLTGFAERIWFGLADAYGPQAPFYVVIGFIVLLILGAIPIVFKKRKDPFARFNFREQRLDGELVKLRDQDDGGGGGLRGISDYLKPAEDSEELTETRKMLRQAGYTKQSAVRNYFMLRATLGLAMLVVGLVGFLLIPEEPRLIMGLAVSAFLAILGFIAPRVWLTRKVTQRKDDLQKAFPDAMDMLLVCIEGGQSLDQAMQRVGKEMQISAGPLAHEFGIISQEFRVGKDRTQVLRDFAERCDVNDISSFVTVMIQSSAFGTSVADALRVYASEMRDKRLMRAEEKANLLPTKLTLGTMFFTVPPLVLILIGPSFIELLRAFVAMSSR